jgi:hypothetical protein
VKVTAKGKQSIVLQRGEWIHADKDDILGIHYDKTSKAGVIPYIQDTDKMSAFKVSALDLSQFSSHNKVNKNLGLAKLVSAGSKHAHKRLPAVKPIFESGKYNY